MEERLVDLHTHLMPGVDDGARDTEVFIDMARMAWEGGTGKLVLTPHTNLHPGTDLSGEQSQKLVGFLQGLLKERRIFLQLFPGAEIMADDKTAEKLKKGEFMTLNHTRYCLIEFEFDEKPSVMERILTDISDGGFFPVVAHPERYFGIQREIAWIERWHEMGWLFQVNKGSITGSFGFREEDCAHRILERKMAFAVASDAHNTSRRNPDMEKLYRYMKEVYGGEYARQLFITNPAGILSAQQQT